MVYANGCRTTGLGTPLAPSHHTCLDESNRQFGLGLEQKRARASAWAKRGCSPGLWAGRCRNSVSNPRAWAAPFLQRRLPFSYPESRTDPPAGLPFNHPGRSDPRPGSDRCAQRSSADLSGAMTSFPSPRHPRRGLSFCARPKGNGPTRDWAREPTRRGEESSGTQAVSAAWLLPSAARGPGVLLAARAGPHRPEVPGACR